MLLSIVEALYNKKGIFKSTSIDKLETLDYITNDDDNSHEEYYKMDRELFIMILKHLEKNGKCTVRLYI